MIIHKTGKKSITHYKIIKSFHNHTYINIQLETGRTHQIRVHMKYIKHPIVGDKKYGKPTSKKDKQIKKKYAKILSFFTRQALHAKTLIFKHPITLNKMKLHAPLPNDMIKLLKILKKEQNNKKQ